MFKIFGEEKIVSICILSFFAASVLMRLLLGILYQSMIREAENMATTNHKLLKQCKLKFANCYQLNDGVPNISVFVDKFISRLALGPLSFESIYHLSGQTMLLSIVGAGVGICKCIMGGRTLGDILPFYIVSFLELYLYFSISTMLDIKGKRRILKVNLVDYLENHFSARIGATEENLEMLYGKGAYGSARGRRTGRRTVEFMPISNRIPLPVNTEDVVKVSVQTQNYAQEPVSGWEDVRDQVSGWEDQEYRRGLEGTQAQALVQAKERSQEQERERQEREKELEELLQEFLTI